MLRLDPAELTIANGLFASVAEEMGVALGRSALSPNIKERRDYSCAVFDPQGRLVAQAAHIPVHLGAMPAAVQAALPLAPFAPGDLVILNDPYLGGTHLPDITMVSPVFYPPSPGGRARPLPSPSKGEGKGEGAGRRRLVGFVASRAHQADVGGMAPGSMPLAQELIQEGIVIPPVRLYQRGRLNQDLYRFLLRNVRTPDERRGDLDAQVAAHRIGEARLQEIVERYGPAETWRRMQALLDYAERMTRAAIAAIPGGTYAFEDYLDDDGISDDPVPIRLRLTVRGDSLHCDFTGSAPQRPSSVNAVAAVTKSAVYYVVRCLLESSLPWGEGARGRGPHDESVPANEGSFRPVSFTLPEASVVNASPPAAVSAGNVETSQRIVDVVLGALAQALPHLIPAASSGSMNNLALGGHLPPSPSKGEGQGEGAFAYYETIAGGAGASPNSDGLDAVHTHMTNTMNTPVEALEMAYPFRILEYAVRRGSGGPGRQRGGQGIRRTYQFLAPAIVTIVSERRRLAPWGLAGGAPAAPGRNTLIPAPSKGEGQGEGAPPSPPKGEGRVRALPSKCQLAVQPGDTLTIETPGGGGWGES